MTQRQHQLLRLLKTASAPLTSAFLGGRLGVSARSIMNDVAAINSAASGTILSSKDGYVLNRAARNRKEGEHEAFASSAAHTQEERIHYLVRSVLLGENDRVKLYRLADHLHVSLDSIKKDIAELQRRLCSTSLTLRTAAGHLELSGDEADKRNLLSESVTEYLSRARLSAEGLQSVFRWFSVKSLQETLPFCISDSKNQPYHDSSGKDAEAFPGETGRGFLPCSSSTMGMANGILRSGHHGGMLAVFPQNSLG